MAMWQQAEDGTYLTWTVDPAIRALCTTRRGGVSEGPFATLNVSLRVGDIPARVVENRRRAARWLGVGLDATVWAEQVHGGEVAVVGQEQRGRGARMAADAMVGVDGLLTSESGVALAIGVADCVPVFLAAPAAGWIGAVHAGWRGTAAEVVVRAIERLEAAGVSPRAIFAGIGPSIRACCYEVDQAVIDRLKPVAPDPLAWTPGRPGHFQLDVARINRDQLERVGVPSDHIAMADRCTACDPDAFFSHRRDRGQTGRLGALIGRWPR